VYKRETKKPLLTEEHMEARYEFARLHGNDFFTVSRGYVWVDEKYFNAGPSVRGEWLPASDPAPVAPTGTNPNPMSRCPQLRSTLTESHFPAHFRVRIVSSTAQTVKHPESLYVMGGMCYHGVLEPYFPPKGVRTDSEGYVEFLKHVGACARDLFGDWNFTLVHVSALCTCSTAVHPFVRAGTHRSRSRLVPCVLFCGPILLCVLYGSASLLQQDNAPVHTSKFTRDYLNEEANHRTLGGWPAQSPDLNPVENLWAIMAQRMRSPVDAKRDTLMREVRAIASGMDPTVVQKLADSWQSRCAAIIDADGGHTGY
jgi:hypothetical protein